MIFVTVRYHATTMHCMHAWKVQTNLMYLESTAGYFAAVFIASKYTTFTLQKQTGCLATCCHQVKRQWSSGLLCRVVL